MASQMRINDHEILNIPWNNYKLLTTLRFSAEY